MSDTALGDVKCRAESRQVCCGCEGVATRVDVSLIEPSQEATRHGLPGLQKYRQHAHRARLCRCRWVEVSDREHKAYSNSK